jgi:hypothetical protein
MTRTVHPHEILVSVCILVVLAAGLFGGGYCLGHSGQANYNEVRDELEQSYGREAAEARLRYEETLSVNVDCRGDESDWAAIRMANAIGFNHDLPVFIHGVCETHKGKFVFPNCAFYARDSVSFGSIDCSGDFDLEITNVPQPEGQRVALFARTGRRLRRGGRRRLTWLCVDISAVFVG